MSVTVREVDGLADFHEAQRVLEVIWSARHVSSALLRALAHAGNPVLAAFDGNRMVGVTAGFLGAEGGLHVHSHITGVLPGMEHAGLGFSLKLAQRDWCLARGIERVVWTFDPLIARNAYFNLAKLGATAAVLFPDFYGVADDVFSHDEPTDRLEADWELSSPRVLGALGGTPSVPDAVVRVAVPEDYLALRERDPATARRHRMRVRDELLAALGDGLIAAGFSRADGYLLVRP